MSTDEQHLLTYDEAWQLQEILSLQTTWEVLAFYQREPGPVPQRLADLDRTPEAVLLVKHDPSEGIFLVTSRQSWEALQMFVTTMAEQQRDGYGNAAQALMPRFEQVPIRHLPVTIVHQ
jgi:hypothetical protein